MLSFKPAIAKIAFNLVIIEIGNKLLERWQRLTLFNKVLKLLLLEIVFYLI